MADTIHGKCIYCDIEIVNKTSDFNSMGVIIIDKNKDSETYMKSYGSAHMICDTRINKDKKFYNWVLSKELVSCNYILKDKEIA